MAVNDVLFDKGGAVFNVKASGYGVTGNGSTDDRGALNTLLASVTAGTLYFPPGTYRIATSLTVPATVGIAFATGARIKPDSGATLTLNGPLQAPLSQVFDTSAGGQVTLGRGVADRVYPQWFGARGDAIRRDGGVGNGATMTLVNPTTLTVPGGFTSTAVDAGKLVTVNGAGPGGVDLYTAISSVTNTSTAILMAAASTPVTDAGVTIGTDDYPAIAAAVQTAIRGTETGGHHSVFFPAGGYLVGNTPAGQPERKPVLSAFPETFKFGILFQGEGIMSSELILRTGGTAQWFYTDSGEGKLAFPTFEGLRFSSDSPAFGNGFRFNDTQGHAQFFVFRTCAMWKLKQGFSFTGTLMDSEMRYYGCKFLEVDQFYYIANNQAVDHEFYGCDIEGVTSDIFYVTGTGGGGVRMFGGSVIWSRDQTHDAYLLKVDTAAVGYGNSDFTFVGIRTEMHTAFAKLVHYTPDGGELVANFDSCNFTGWLPGVDREVVHIGLNKSVRFAACSIPADWRFRIDTDDSRAPGYPTHGIIGFEACVVPPDLSSRITLKYNTTQSRTYGRAYARDCHVRHEGSAPVREAVNFDFNGFNDMPGDPGSIVKVAVIKPTGFTFPVGGAAEHTLRMPVGATIRSIQVYRPAASGSAAYQLHVGSDDKSVILASSTLGTDAGAHTIHADVFHTVGSARTIRLWANPAGQVPVAGGYAIVEYY